jgi:hypothetical protein
MYEKHGTTFRAHTYIGPHEIARLAKHIGNSVRGRLPGFPFIRFEGAHPGRLMFSIRSWGGHVELMPFCIDIARDADGLTSVNTHRGHEADSSQGQAHPGPNQTVCRIRNLQEVRAEPRRGAAAVRPAQCRDPGRKTLTADAGQRTVRGVKTTSMAVRWGIRCPSICTRTPAAVFLSGVPQQDRLIAALGAPRVAEALREARRGGVTALSLATVADLALLPAGPDSRLRAGRSFAPGQALCDHRRRLDGLRQAVAAAGVSALTLVHYRINELGDVQTEPPVHGGRSAFGREVVAECNRVGADHVGIGTDLDGNCRPVLTGYQQLDTVAEYLAARRLSDHEITHILGGNAFKLFERVRG